MNDLNLRNILLTEEDINDIFKRGGLDIKCNDYTKYIKSFTHPSYVKPEDYNILFDILNLDKDEYVNFKKVSYEIPEFVGDTAVNYCITRYIFNRYRETNEGFMTTLKTKLVSQEYLAEIGRYLGFNRYILLSNHMENSNGRNKDNVLEDIFEAFIYAMEDDGFDIYTIKQFIDNVIEECFDLSKIIFNNNNYKDRMQKYAQKHNIKLEFEILSKLGQPAKTFVVACMLDNKMISTGHATGSGKVKKKAEHHASLKALIKLNEMSLEEKIFIRKNANLTNV